jgi:hypothetical protein
LLDFQQLIGNFHDVADDWRWLASLHNERYHIRIHVCYFQQSMCARHQLFLSNSSQTCAGLVFIHFRPMYLFTGSFGFLLLKARLFLFLSHSSPSLVPLLSRSCLHPFFYPRITITHFNLLYILFYSNHPYRNGSSRKLTFPPSPSICFIFSPLIICCYSS